MILRRVVGSVAHVVHDSQFTRQPTIASACEDRFEVAFEEGAGVLEVLFGVGFGGGDARKRFVEDADHPPLLGGAWHCHADFFEYAD